MATAPIFTATPIVKLAQVSTANTNRDGTGTVVDVVTGASDGTRVDRITVKATVTTTAGMVRLFIYDGTNTRLWREVPVTAVTPSASVAAFEYILSGLNMVLPHNHVIRAATHNAEAINVILEGGDF